MRSKCGLEGSGRLATESPRGLQNPGAACAGVLALSLGKPRLLEPHFPLENRHHSGPRVGGFSMLPGSGEDPLNLFWRSSEASPLSSRAGYSHWFTFCPLMRETEAREGQGLPQGPGHLQTPLPAFCLLQLHLSPPPPQRVLASHIARCQGKAPSPCGSLRIGPSLLCSQGQA